MGGNCTEGGRCGKCWGCHICPQVNNLICLWYLRSSHSPTRQAHCYICLLDLCTEKFWGMFEVVHVNIFCPSAATQCLQLHRTLFSLTLTVLTNVANHIFLLSKINVMHRLSSSVVNMSIKNEMRSPALSCLLAYPLPCAPVWCPHCAAPYLHVVCIGCPTIHYSHCWANRLFPELFPHQDEHHGSINSYNGSFTCNITTSFYRCNVGHNSAGRLHEWCTHPIFLSLQPHVHWCSGHHHYVWAHGYYHHILTCTSSSLIHLLFCSSPCSCISLHYMLTTWLLCMLYCV